MTYKNYRVDDFLADEQFQEWVLHPSHENHSHWCAFLQQHPEKEEVIARARKVLLLAAVKEKDTLNTGQEDRLWHRIQDSIHLRSHVPFQKKPFSKGNSVSHRVFMRVGIAASIGVTALLALFYFFYWQNEQSKIYKTAYQETKNIILPDGSQVMLNANSALRVEAVWSTDEVREVWLEGEAFFEVEKKGMPSGERRFIVHTANLDVEVLGTKFNVNDRQDRTCVVLASGKVKLKMQQDGRKAEMTMIPGEMVEFSRKKKALSKKTVNPEVYSAWKDNKLIFDNTPVSEICQTLKNTYGWEVVLKNTSIAERKYTGTFPDPDPEMILKTMATALDIKITQKDDQVIFE